MQESEQIVATPRLGIAKGIVAILLGMEGSGIVFAIAFAVFFLATDDRWGELTNPTPDPYSAVALMVMAVLPPIIFGFFLWRGIVAIRKRRVKRVTYVNFGLWVVSLVSLPLTVVTLILYIFLGPAWLLSWWGLWVIVAAYGAAIGIGAYLDTRKMRSKASP
ncbi:MAG: hypothetical protein IBX67_02135 [Dehalococcoidia bacterium]|nr:hypothetical protein [Dehalococcoidia bacterium]